MASDLKPTTPSGTRDFLPDEMLRRDFIFNSCRQVFRKYGYLPIETPAMEKIETLMGKYGEEGDRLIFKIFNRGEKLNVAIDNLSKEINNITKSDLVQIISKLTEHVDKNINMLADTALRYDLTVPFARYVVQHQNDITFPFKRYQIQPVWRADRPQKGRYREFYQCDVDVIGSDSLLNEVELIQMIDEVFSKLGISVTIKINNRKILIGIAEVYNLKEKFKDFIITLDKIDKIGLEGVEKEIKEKGLEQIDIRKIVARHTITEGIKFSVDSEMAVLNKMFLDCRSDIGKKGIEEVMYIANTVSDTYKLKNPIEFDNTLARGLDYYTGTIIEVSTRDFPGSICGGGRYDNLTGVFGLKGVSGVGVSFGADRIYDVMSMQDLFTEHRQDTTKIMFVNFGREEAAYSLKLLARLRKQGIPAELYPDASKMKKQLGYADKKGIPYVALVGSEEMKSGSITIKNMISGEQEKCPADQLVQFFSRI